MVAKELDLKGARAIHLAGQQSEAERLYRSILCQEPKNAEATYFLALLHVERGDEHEAIRLLMQAIKFDPRLFNAYKTAAKLNLKLGNLASATLLYGEWYRLDPTNEQARHMTAATSGNHVPLRASDGYIKGLFNRCAATFDVSLRELGYRGPEIVAAALLENAGSPRSLLDVLDGGCGTGLCGPLVRKHCRTLVGVDLSEEMISRARQRGCYDDLVVNELSAFMRTRRQSFDVVVLADTLEYFGDLDEVFGGASTALSHRGLFIATLEALLDPKGENYRLGPHGRFAHCESYVRATLAKHRLEEISLSREFLRREFGKEVIAYLLVARSSR